MNSKKRCSWCEGDALYEQYHDEEWGVPVHDDRALFECLMLECFQAGLSWITILRKRDNFRRLFHSFDIEWCSRIGSQDIELFLQDAGIIRHRKKIEAVKKNALAVVAIQEECGSFSDYIWSFANGASRESRRSITADSIPTTNDTAKNLAKDLKKRGMSFVGPSICYAFMQAVGMVNDHTDDCFRSARCKH